MSQNLSYLQSQLNNRKSHSEKISSSLNKPSRHKDDFIKSNRVFAYQHELDKHERRDRINKRRGEDFALTEAQDEARKQKMKEGIKRYNALKANKAKPTSEEKDLLQFDGNLTSDSSDYDSDDHNLDALTEAEDELGRTVLVSRRQKEILNPLSNKHYRVKGTAIYGDKLSTDWNVYEQSPEEIERFKAHYSDKGYIRDPTKDKDQRHKGASFYKFGDDSIKQQQINDLKASHHETIIKRDQAAYSYRNARMMLVKQYQPNRIIGRNRADNLIDEAINTS
ncbi:hypothetical protein E3P77_00022 [Wallemia ichthyophaga]|uniref:Uncharacterized protein n=1 Tax=Wallemia ichthyophaga TaxID=245174 RepID=A0A4T0LK80_WALIC|nr:hypothetical protein E3P91_00022 [Wallemia ichthyophaga]TIA84258.1 hypothetical protein E3P98_00274 [Wallemia ichthyophaga]TIA94402.1 hypothetical protein E3P97_00022 [Wallemia ichthyophaga]TIB04748.1 hypothetical protein E3P95_00022 [Wallemia ichthyophaga]TIB06066.1 hypothetical protein E3P94_00022 [Wallemia ichthyophaga]